ncbi:uncharacterized protein LOC115874584 [Sitophilus oryzae]|uniref:Uncharacterized protein LOC115874584 n=1 Tax=Sitophilus oryzae TaxID=7048 RepID=A0A6J2X353_SITOR|nr:uncharacterized protein LOC115874584 [Sitophilus oryzae]
MAEEEEQTAKKDKKEKSTRVHVRIGKPFPVHCFEKGKKSSWSNYLSALPTIPEKTGKYTPMPYTFRLPPSPKPIQVKNVIAKCPPFYVLLDHAIAVIWMVFSGEKYDCPLGIAQLQWALAFLKTIYARTGERPKDVEVCVEAIEDILIDRYAALSKEIDKVDKINERSDFTDGALHSKTVKKINLDKFVFSKNYEDLAARMEPDDLSKVPSITSEAAQEELDNLKKAAGVESIEKLDTVSKDKAVNVLKMWYQEQTGKIKEEVKKLKSIQEQIQHVNNANIDFLDAAQMETFFEE